MHGKEEMERVLRAAGCRITEQRKAVLEYLSSTDTHPSADQVYREVKTFCPRLSLATVYNTLGMLARMGLIKVMDFDSMENRHETNLKPHINLICTRCGKIQDFEERTRINRKKVKEQLGFEVNDFRIEYYGICAQCRDEISNDS